MGEKEKFIPEEAQNFKAPEEGAEAMEQKYTQQSIEWPSDIPESILKELPKDMQQGPDVKSTFDVTRDPETHRIEKIVLKEVSTSGPHGTAMPETIEQTFTFEYDKKGNIKSAQEEESSQMVQISGSMNPEYETKSSSRKIAA